MRSLGTLSAVASLLSSGMGQRVEVVRREPAPPVFSYVPPKMRRHRDRARVELVAGPGGFRWHVKLDGFSISTHHNKAAAEKAASVARENNR